MLTTRLGPEQLKELEQNVREAAKKFPGEVAWVRYSFGEDWSGDPAIYFRIVLTDEASSGDRLREVADRVENALFDDLRLSEPEYSEYNAYFNFRSKSEVDKLKEPEWE